MQNRMLAVLVFASSIALAAQPSFSQDGPPPSHQGEAHPHRPLPKPVNLQVLPKDIAPEKLIQIMRGFSGALGVECNFCHEPGAKPHQMDFASDKKPEKETARLMLRMSQTIDDDYLAKINDPDAKPEDKRVTCGTCHRGHSMPTQFVPPPEEHHGAAPAAAPSAPGNLQGSPMPQ